MVDVWNALGITEPSLKAKLFNIKDVPNGLKCHACAATFTNTIQKTRHFEKKAGKSVC